MIVSGGEAANFDAVRLDSFATVNSGTLLSANDDTGYVAWTDRTGTERTATLGGHAIRIVPRRIYKR